MLARLQVGFEHRDLRIAPRHGGAQVHDVAVEDFAALLALAEQRGLFRVRRRHRRQLFLERRDAIGAREQLVLELGHVCALNAEAFPRGVQRFQVPGQLLAQLGVLGVDARDCHVAFGVGDAGALD